MHALAPVRLHVFVDVAGLPEVLGRAGSAGATSCNPERAPADAPADGSYWWTFQRLLDAAKGDELGTAFAERQAQVRDAFDPLETAWRAELADVLDRAAALRSSAGPETGAEVLAAFTRRCVDTALVTASALLDRFAGGSTARR